MTFLRRNYPDDRSRQRDGPSQKLVCEVCHHKGSRGAEWILELEGKKSAVHYPCGRGVMKEAPESANTRLFPSPNLIKKTRANAFLREKLAIAIMKKVLDGDGGESL